MRTRLLPFLALLPAVSGCLDKISAPTCSAVAFTQASVSADTVMTTTGLRYIEGTVGPGAAVDWCNTVVIHYDAFLLDGTPFDNSRDADSPLVFSPGLGALIDGLEQGVIGLRVGGTRRLIIPPALGFGPEPRRDQDGQIVIPGNSTVVYDIEVVQVAQ
jgi:FKBP-type peptidyl-prolyl cis-trans isomerase